MRLTSVLALLFASILATACSGADASVSTDGGGGDGGGSDGGAGSDGALSDSGGGDAAQSDGGGNDAGPLSCANAPVVQLTIGNCATFVPCGGEPTGTWQYTKGCLPDPFAAAGQNCQGLKVTQQSATVQGCVELTGGLVGRDVKTSYSATASFPLACALGNCANAQTALKQYFQNVTCTNATTTCNCTVSSSYSNTAADTYSTSNNQIVTGSGQHYDYCVNGASLDSTHASGGAAEPGTYTLTKQ